MSYKVETKTEHGDDRHGGEFATIEEARSFAAKELTADFECGASLARIEHPDGTKEYWQQRVTLSVEPDPYGAQYFEDES